MCLPSVFSFHCSSFALGLGCGWLLPKKVGNYQDPKIIKKCKAERHKFGSFYYRYPHGESASDVVRSFLHQWSCVFVIPLLRNWRVRWWGLTLSNKTYCQIPFLCIPATPIYYYSTIEFRPSLTLFGGALNLVELRTTSLSHMAYPSESSSLDTFGTRLIVSFVHVVVALSSIYKQEGGVLIYLAHPSSLCMVSSRIPHVSQSKELWNNSSWSWWFG